MDKTIEEILENEKSMEESMGLEQDIDVEESRVLEEPITIEDSAEQKSTHLVDSEESDDEEDSDAEYDANRFSIDELEEEFDREVYKDNYKRMFRSTIYILLTVASAALIIAVMFLPMVQISGTSMTETLQDRDIVMAVRGSKYEMGEVVAFNYNSDVLIKRVIAAPGDWVDITEEGDVYVNNRLLDEPYISEKSLGDCNIELPYQVPENKIFVMGDHRATSIDSRNTSVGCISEDVVIGKIFIRIWPLNQFGSVY